MIDFTDYAKSVEDPLTLYPFGMVNHFSPKGYRLLAGVISKRLKADGIIPLNSRN